MFAVVIFVRIHIAFNLNSTITEEQGKEQRQKSPSNPLVDIATDRVYFAFTLNSFSGHIDH